MIEITHQHTGEALFVSDDGTLCDAVQAAVRSGAYLRGADLEGANLRGAVLGDHGKLIGRGILQIGPIGSRNDYLLAFYSETGIIIHAGCFFDTLVAFASAVEQTHGDNDHARHYRAAIALIEACAPEEA